MAKQTAPTGSSGRPFGFGALDGRIEDRIRRRRRGAERDVGLVDLDRGLETFAVKGLAVGRQVAGVGEPQTAVLRKLDELLESSASERVLADQIRAIVALERGGEYLGGSCCARRDEQRHRAVDRSISRLGGDLGGRLDVTAALLCERAGLDEETRCRDAVLNRPLRGTAEVDDEALRARFGQIGNLFLQV